MLVMKDYPLVGGFNPQPIGETYHIVKLDHFPSISLTLNWNLKKMFLAIPYGRTHVIKSSPLLKAWICVSDNVHVLRKIGEGPLNMTNNTNTNMQRKVKPWTATLFRIFWDGWYTSGGSFSQATAIYSPVLKTDIWLWDLGGFHWVLTLIVDWIFVYFWLFLLRKLVPFW